MKRNYKNKKIVCFGGGNAMSKVLLPGLKRYPVKITSVTSMVENGGSTGELREDLNILPPGDISRHLVALSDGPNWKKNLFLFRFGREEFPGGHKGHRFGTVFIAGLEYVLKDFEKALKIATEFLEVKKHQALPANLTKTHLLATLENGKTIKGEDEIDVPKIHNGNLKIKKIYLKLESDIVDIIDIDGIRYKTESILNIDIEIEIFLNIDIETEFFLNIDIET